MNVRAEEASPADTEARPPLLLALFDQGLVSGANFLTTVLIGRTLGMADLGIYALGFTTMVLIGVVQESLVSVPYTVFGSRREGEKRALLAGTAFVHHIAIALMAVIVIGSAAGIIALSGERGHSRLAGILAATVPAFLLREFGRRLLFAHLSFPRAILLDLIAAAVQLGGLFLLAWDGRLTLPLVFVTIALANLSAAVPWLISARGDLRVRWTEARRAVPTHWSFARWIFGDQVTAVGKQYGGRWLLALLLGTWATGVYSAVLSMTTLSNPLLFGLGNAVMPASARAYARGGSSDLRRVLRRAALILAGCTGVLTVLLAVFGGRLLVVLYGPDYAGNGMIVAFLAVAFFVGGLTMPAAHSLQAMERPDVAFRAGVANLVVTFVAVAVLAPRGGLLGASWGFLFGQVTGVTICWAGALRLLRRRGG